MKFKASASSSKVVLEDGVYTGILEKITAWTATKKEATTGKIVGDFPRLELVWNLGADDNGGEIRVYDRIWLPVDGSGEAKRPHERSAMYNRCSALFGERYPAADADMEMALPKQYDSAEGLATLPRFEERKEEGFRPVEVRSLVVNGKEMVGLECQLEIKLNANGYNDVVSASPLPKRKVVKPVARPVATEEQELPV